MRLGTLDTSAADRIFEPQNGNGSSHNGDSHEAGRELPEPTPLGDLIEDNPELLPVVVDGLVRETETINLIAQSKVGKTFLVDSLALAVANGSPWLGYWPTVQGDVLIVDNELHKSTLADRFKKVIAASGLVRDSVQHRISVLSLRGQLLDIRQLGALLARHVVPGRVKLVIIDALYRALPEDVNENDNAQMARVYNWIDAYAERTRAAFLLVHHGSKGNQSAKSVTDVGSGAGSISRATDNHIILREHETEDAVVMEARCRSFKSPAPMCLRWRYPLWQLAPDLDPKRLRRDPAKGGRPRKDAAEKEDVIPWTPEAFVAKFIGPEPIRKDVLVSRASRERVPQRTVMGLIAEAEAAGLIHKHSTGTTCGVAYSTVPPTLFTGPETGKDAPPTHDQAKRLARRLAKSFPCQVTSEQFQNAMTTFRKISIRAAEEAIAEHVETQNRLDWPLFLAACEAYESKQSKARAPLQPPLGARDLNARDPEN